MASCCITVRIKPAITHLIGRQQKAYITNNNIGSVIINLINLIKHVTDKQKNAIILLIDFRKAFDTISHSFLHNTLHTLGFGRDIISWVKLFLNNRNAQILMGGNLTNDILLKQGVPLGDVISPYLFILMVEMLLIKINFSKNLKGITFATHESRSETFADDTTIFLERGEANLRTATKYIQNFYTISGLACNIDKTNIIPIGSNTNTADTLCPELNMEWTNTFTILGFEVDNKLAHLTLNFQKIKDKIKSIISKWKPYHLSLKGRITIAKTKLCSQLTYIATVLDTNDTIINDIQKQINNYINNTKPNGRNWINNEMLYIPTERGGLGMIRLTNFCDAIKVSWVRRYAIDKINDHWLK